jgi:hypothetical protein
VGRGRRSSKFFVHSSRLRKGVGGERKRTINIEISNPEP